MSTHRNIDKICIVIVAFTLVIAVVFCGMSFLGVTKDVHAIGYENRIFDRSKVHTTSTSVVYASTITVTCASTGGLGTKQYQVLYYSPKAQTWYTAKAYSTSTTASIKFNYTGNYIVRVKVKDERGIVVSKDITVNVYGVLKNTSTVSETSVKVGSTITVNCSSEAYKGNPQYEVTYYSPKTKVWYTAKAYSTTTSVKIKLSYTGKYTVRVKVKDDRNTEVTKDLTVESKS